MSLRGLFFRFDARKRELQAELQSHLCMAIAERIAQGETPEQARLAALREFGNVPLIEDVTRSAWGGVWLEQLGQDIRYALRGMAKSPGVTIVSVLSLMLGIGASVALFSVVYGTLIAPFPYAKPDQIWWLSITAKDDPLHVVWGRHVYSAQEFQELESSHLFSAAWAVAYEQDALTGDDIDAERAVGVRMTGQAFNQLGVQPLMGRTVQPSDTRADGTPAPVVVLSYKFWKRFFRGDPHVLGRKLNVNQVAHTVIGVMPDRFGYWTDDAFWMPMPMGPADKRFMFVSVRLRPGISQSMAEQQLDQFNQRMAAITPAHFPKGPMHAVLVNHMSDTRANWTKMRQSLNLLFAAVGLLLLIACVNVAHLQLARMTVRSQEVVMRIAIGAGRARLIRQLLTESLLLSLAGGLLGILFSFAVTHIIVALIPPGSLPNEARVTVNGYVLLFAVSISMLTGILFGLAPALYGSRLNLAGGLKHGRGGAHGQAIRNWLMMTEIALSVMLLSNAGLAIRYFVQLDTVDIGFHASHTIFAAVPQRWDSKPDQYKTIEQRDAFTQDLCARVRALPGVEAVAVGYGGMPVGFLSSKFAISGQPRAEDQRISISFISSDYLNTMGIPLKRGRALTPSEVQSAAHVALVNEAAASLWKLGQDPVNGHIHLDFLEKPPKQPQVLVAPGFGPDMTVVGVIGDTRDVLRLEAATEPAIYIPYTLMVPEGMELAVRVHGDAQLITKQMQEQLRQLDPNVPLVSVPTLDELRGLQTARPRFNMTLFSAFAALGLILATIGIYCVVSFNVTQRSREIGVRMALGALPADILRWVMRKVATIAALGLLVGLSASFLLQRIMHSTLFGNNSLDLISTATVVMLLSAAALLAGWLPARRAGRLNPVTALRREA